MRTFMDMAKARKMKASKVSFHAFWHCTCPTTQILLKSCLFSAKVGFPANLHFAPRILRKTVRFSLVTCNALASCHTNKETGDPRFFILGLFCDLSRTMFCRRVCAHRFGACMALKFAPVWFPNKERASFLNLFSVLVVVSLCNWSTILFSVGASMAHGILCLCPGQKDVSAKTSRKRTAPQKRDDN